VANIPSIKSGGYGFSLLLCLAYGASIGFVIIVSFGTLYAVTIYRSIQVGVFNEPTQMINTMTGICSASLGVVLAQYIQSLILNRPMTLSSTWYSVIIGIFIALMFLFYYSWEAAKEENLKLKAAKAESELHVLKNQMQPHFLFNSLNSLLDLVETKNEQAPEMTMRLSSLYREILENSKKNLASLDSEISIIRKYLELEKLRFGDRLSFEIQIPKNSSDIFLPPLVLQTLVENAIKHGISSSLIGGTIKVAIEPQLDGYYLLVSNSGSSPDFGVFPKGTGLENTKARLKLIYGDRHKFQIKKEENWVNASFWFSGEIAHG